MRLYDATRTIAVVAGLLGAVMFYQPWVSGTVPGVGAVKFSADDLANGRARTIADIASAPPPRAPSGAAPAAPAAPATGGAPSLPTRVPTFAPGAVAPTTMPSAAERIVAAGNATPTPMAVGGMTLPTRVPTFAPGAVAPTTMPSAAERTALATPIAGGNALVVASPTPVPAATPPPPAKLPKLTLFAIPLAGLGIAVFMAIHSRHSNSRDIIFSKGWTILLGLVGMLSTWNVISTISGAPAPNNLMDPGETRDLLWGAWATLAAFAVGTAAIATSWALPPVKKVTSPLP